ncbi:MAG: hypothetical protein GY786_09590, partial [Proteobacteria bacterium]|nr:hypothetical protein [Pseudomonadota bacterium]
DMIPDMTDDEGIKEFSNHIHKSGSNLLNIIEDIFNLAMIEQSEVTVRKNEVYIRDIYLELKQQLQEILTDSQKTDTINLNFKIDSEIVSRRILTDRSKVMQVMANLIKNAVKYTHRGTIGLEVHLGDEDHLMFSIHDTGIGISKDKHQLIFDFFRQGDDTHTRQHGGVGIGLAISQRIARAMGGHISVESEAGEGSVFSFILSMEPAEENSLELEVSENRQAEKEQLDLSGAKVLLVEDDKTSSD